MKRALVFALIGVCIVPFYAHADVCFNGNTYDTNGNVTGTCSTDQTTTSGSAGSTPIAAQSFLTNGLFGCNETGAYAMNVGTMAAQGSNVPVYDAAVTENTGYLVYEECVLRNVVDRQREAATAAFTNQIVQSVNSNPSRNGQPQFSVNLPLEQSNIGNQVANTMLNGNYYNSLNSALRSQVVTQVGRDYYVNTNSPQSLLSCPYTGNLQTVWDGNPDQGVFAALSAMEDPNCDPTFATINAENQLNAAVAAAQQNQLTQLNWGNGFYPVTDANGNVTTPGIVVQGILMQALESPLNQLQAANDIGQLIGGAFAGLTSQIVGNINGLSGAGPYLGSVVNQEAKQVGSTVTNSALSSLDAVIQNESNYYSILSNMVNELGPNQPGAIWQLRNAESQCWSSVVSAVCASAPTVSAAGTQTCTDAAGDTLTIATSTVFSDNAINNVNIPSAGAPIAQYGKIIAQNAQTALNNYQTLVALKSAIQSSDQATQQKALAALDQLEAQQPSVLPTQNDVMAMNQKQQDLTTALTDQSTGFIPGIYHTWQGYDSNGGNSLAWNGNTSSPTGWCNVSNQTTIQNWIKAWMTTPATTNNTNTNGGTTNTGG